MTDSLPIDSNHQQRVTPEMFARFLGLLAPDADEAGRRYTDLHQKLTGFFRMKGISDPPGAADETIDRAILKIEAGAVVPDPEKYCRGIAQNIAKERYRLIRREDSAVRRFIQELSHSSIEKVERIYGVLKPCFEQLGVEERQLLLAYCDEVQGQSHAKYRRQLAERMKISVLALRIRVTRLRNRLTDCVRKRSNDLQQETPDV